MGNEVISSPDKAASYLMVGRREAFARLIAQDMDPYDAYCQAYGHNPIEAHEVLQARQQTSRILGVTQVRLRIQELRQPIIRKLQRKIEYGLTHALTECQTAYDLALEQADPKAMLKATEMKARLSKLLSDEVNVNHRFGLLDDTDTATLLEMKATIERRRVNQKQLGGGVIVEGTIVAGQGPPPSLPSEGRVPSEAEVPSPK